MELVIATVIGTLFAAGVYLLLRRHPVQLIIGFTLIFNATNLLVFTVGGINYAGPPLIAKGAQVPAAGFADPLPQALVLTAIVISFGFLAFALVLLRRLSERIDTTDLSNLRNTEQ